MKASFPIALLLCATALLLSACQSAETEPAAAFPAGDLIDLTYAYDENTVYWPTAAGFELTVESADYTEGGYYYAANSFRSAEHGGTHLDAPIHFAAGRQTSDQIPLDRLVGPAIVIDVTEACAENPDYLVTATDIEQAEIRSGTTVDGKIVLLRTGFGQYWPDRARYMGTDERGPEAVAKLHFPGLAPEAARWLVENRTIKAIGLDTPSIDHGPSKDFATHRVLFEQNIPAFENVANLDQLPLKDFYVAALPMKIAGGSGGPLRIIALLP